MANVVEEIPEHIQPAATAALEWINAQQDADFKLTGLVDPDLQWQPADGSVRELALVLCDDGACARESVRIQLKGEAFDVAPVAAQEHLIPPHLDPPEGIRKDWLAERVAEHELTAIIFYRGFW